jgi:pyruvate/2-oxoglutarate dehydrogenase complex dihydrolipoamide acyltransferase (E2) component
MSKPTAYVVEPKNKFFEVIRAIAEYEIRPGNTVMFVAEVDLTEVQRVRQAAGPRKPSYTAFVVKAVALALREHPYANRRVWRRSWLPFLFGPRLQRFHRCDVAVAVERDFPGAESIAFMDILRDADGLSLAKITEELHDLAVCDVTNNRQWREFATLVGRLPSWLSTLLIRMPNYLPSFWVKYRGGAALVSSPAKYGVDVVAGAWTHPIGVSFGLVKPRPVVRDDVVVPCTTFALTLSFDRRVMAGAQGARFFKRMVDLLERAETEMAPYLSPAAPERSLLPAPSVANGAPDGPAS